MGEKKTFCVPIAVGRSWHNDGAEKIKRTDVLDGDAESTNPQFYLSSELPGMWDNKLFYC